MSKCDHDNFRDVPNVYIRIWQSHIATGPLEWTSGKLHLGFVFTVKTKPVPLGHLVRASGFDSGCSPKFGRKKSLRRSTPSDQRGFSLDGPSGSRCEFLLFSMFIQLLFYFLFLRMECGGRNRCLTTSHKVWMATTHPLSEENPLNLCY